MGFFESAVQRHKKFDTKNPDFSYTLPPRYYYDRAIFEREKRAIFYKS